MRKIRGFKLGKRLLTAYRRLLWRRRTPSSYHRLDSQPCEPKNKPISKLSNWCNWACLKTKAQRLCSKKPCPGYLRLGQEPIGEKAASVPKGHMAVYVGQKDGGDGEFSRVLVPVIYFNHPLFGQLLREAEEEYGYDHPGGITIPCRISEFEKVQTTIAAGRRCRKLLTGRRLHY
ncbi:hypothetical protein L1049_018366 [Liquidambar formosana]|uniref:Small auxin up regulated protein n=1 Tax=Liquidambar formosana TaxID=63359 RepID=A0AAP0RA61_LIQFO